MNRSKKRYCFCYTLQKRALWLRYCNRLTSGLWSNGCDATTLGKIIEKVGGTSAACQILLNALEHTKGTP